MRRLILTTAIVTSVALAACGGDDDATATATSAPQTNPADSDATEVDEAEVDEAEAEVEVGGYCAGPSAAFDGARTPGSTSSSPTIPSRRSTTGRRSSPVRSHC